MANEDYRIQAYKRVAGMGEGETPVEAPQDSFTPNVAADLVRASMNSPNSIRGTVNGVPVGTGIAVSLGAGNPAGRGNDVVEVGGSAAKGKEKKKKATVAGKWSLQDLLATALGKSNPDTWSTSYQQPASTSGREQQFTPRSLVGGAEASSAASRADRTSLSTRPGFVSSKKSSSQGSGTARSATDTLGNVSGIGSQLQGVGKRNDGSTGKRSASASATATGGMIRPGSGSANQDFMRHGLIKVPEAPREADGRENIYRRVAKFLLLIGTDEAAKVISHLTPEQTERIIPEIASIRRVDPAEAEVILAEFKTLLDNARQQGGVTTARTILEKAFGSQRAEELISKAVPFPEGVPFDYLQEMDGQRIFALLRDEPTPVRTLVLSRIKPAVAAEVINQMDSEDKKDTIRRLAKLAPMDPEILRRVDKAMHDKVLLMNTTSADAMDGRGALTEILKRMSPNAEKDILSALSDLDPDLSNDIRDRLFTMDDILMADDRFLQKKLHTMGEGEIALLIAGKPEPFRQKILSNVSKTRGDIILEEEELRRPMRRRDCDEVTAQFFSVLRRAWEEGSLIIYGRSDDIYV